MPTVIGTEEGDLYGSIVISRQTALAVPRASLENMLKDSAEYVVQAILRERDILVEAEDAT